MVAKPSQISIKPSVTVWGENVTDMYRQEPYLSEECLTYFTHFPEWNTVFLMSVSDQPKIQNENPVEGMKRWLDI